MEMFNGGIRKLHIIAYFLILGIITPIGIIIGIVVTEHAGEGGDGTHTLVIGVLQGLAGGTLLYITFYEVLDREKLAKAGMTGILGCFLLTCGFAFMAGMEAAGTYIVNIFVIRAYYKIPFRIFPNCVNISLPL